MIAAENAAAKRVRCPVCNAQPGFSCRKARSLKDARLVMLKRPHRQRIVTANDNRTEGEEN